MCGIFGYVGKKDAFSIVINGLKKLEYRGYDSAGVAGINGKEIFSFKTIGKLTALEEEIKPFQLNLPVAIGHTRWATHGTPTVNNAHPQFDEKKTLALVHNGIIENHDALRKSLERKGIKFVSDTDTETVAQLISSLYEGDIFEALQKAIKEIQGAYAIALIHKDYPNQVIAIANHSPLVIGIGENEIFISSDSQAFVSFTKEAIYLSDNEVAIIESNKVQVFNSAWNEINKPSTQLKFDVQEVSKGNYEHFTLKEIFQQPQTIRNALNGRFLEEYGTVSFEEVNFDIEELQAVERVLILGCGTSLHAGYIGAYMIEEKARLPVRVEIASEFRYKNPVIPHGTFVIALSQSGETADTLACIREVQAKGAKVLSICNVESSTMARESSSCIFLNAGPEIGVCSTKAFTSQVVVLTLLTVLLARMRHMGKTEGQNLLKALYQLPDQVQHILDQSESIREIAEKYASYKDSFFIGRHYMYPTSLEGALKLKEIAYVNANGYAAGEMKHGPIALLSPECPVIALCCNQATLNKMSSNLTEVKARNSRLLAIAEEGDNFIKEIADDTIFIPKIIDELAPVTATVVTQLIAYYIARARGEDIDQPRNLAKSVTVE